MDWGVKKVIAVGGGKGGVGKSSFAGNLGVLLAQKGLATVLVDADLGAANLHTITGVAYPEKTLDDFLQGRQKSLADTLLDTPVAGLRLLSSANDILSIAAPNYSQRQKLLRAIQKLNADAIIFDIAAGSHSRAIDFFSLAPLGIIIVEPTPTSMENAFSFLKNLMYRHLLRVFFHDKEKSAFIVNATDPRNAVHFLQFNELITRLETMDPQRVAQYRALFAGSGAQSFLVVNSVRTPEQFAMADRFTRIVKRYLTLDMTVLGALPYEPLMDTAIVSRTPFVVKYPQAGYSRGLAHICKNLGV